MTSLLANSQNSNFPYYKQAFILRQSPLTIHITKSFLTQNHGHSVSFFLHITLHTSIIRTLVIYFNYVVYNFVEMCLVLAQWNWILLLNHLLSLMVPPGILSHFSCFRAKTVVVKRNCI